MKFLALQRTIGTKTSIIIGLLILLFTLPLITQRDFYPIVAFNMFAQVHTESVGVMYSPYVINDRNDLLINESFNPWPIRRSDIHNTIDYWVKNDLAESRLIDLTPFLLQVARKQNGSASSRFKCYGIMQTRWPLNAPLSQRKQLMETKKITEYCDEK